MVGSRAIICMPTDAPALKVEATRRYGAEIVFYDRMKDDRAALAARIASETGRARRRGALGREHRPEFLGPDPQARLRRAPRSAACGVNRGSSAGFARATGFWGRLG